jgi:fused signal recognition particle receptor
MSFFSRLKDGLAKTRKGITEKIDQVLVSFGKVDEELFEELEEVLVTADLGVETAVRIMDDTRKKVKEKKITDPLKIRELIRETLIGILGEETQELDIESSPAVIMVTGVNGVGKTTSIGKIAYNLKNQGKKVMLAAADTFRAAAIDQLEVWAYQAAGGIRSGSCRL